MRRYTQKKRARKFPSILSLVILVACAIGTTAVTRKGAVNAPKQTAATDPGISFTLRFPNPIEAPDGSVFLCNDGFEDAQCVVIGGQCQVRFARTPPAYPDNWGFGLRRQGDDISKQEAVLVNQVHVDQDSHGASPPPTQPRHRAVKP